MMLNNSRCMIANTTAKYGSKSAVKLLFFQGNKNYHSLLIRPISSTKLASNNFLYPPKQPQQSQSTASNKPIETTPSKPQQSQQPPKKSSSYKIAALALTGFTVGLGFATLNPDSRRQIQKVAPQANQLFDMIDELLGRKKTAPSSLQLPSKLPDKVQTEVKLKTVQAEPEKPKEVKIVAEVAEAVPASLVSSAPPASPASPVIEPVSTPLPILSSTKQTEKEPEKSTEPVVASAALAEVEPVVVVAEPTLEMDWKRTLKRHELQEEATIDAIETKLNASNVALRTRINEVVLSIGSSIENLNKYSQALRDALDENKNDETKDQQWKQVTDLFYIQMFSVNETNLKIDAVNKSIQELEAFLAEVKSSELSDLIKNMRSIQLDLVEQCHRLQTEKTKLSEAIIHANVLRSYTNEQKAARNQFLKEMQALQPDGIQVSNRNEDQLSNDEINNLLIHAHKRVLQLQKQIEKLQAQQSQQIQKALEEQREQNAQLLKDNEASLNAIWQKELAIEKDKILENEKVKKNEEIKKELSRQAAAHNNHLAQMLKLQQDELKQFYDKKLSYENEKTRHEFYSKVAESLGRIKGIENAINVRANLELQSNNAKQLWLAIQNLNQLLSHPAAESNLNHQEIVSIKSNLEMIRQSAPENEFIQKVLASVPENALDSGVWTEPDLKARFYKLKKICSRVALIDERGGSLFKYFISYLQSFFIMHAKVKVDDASTIQLEDINLNSTFSLLDYAEHFIENDNIDAAIRLMQQLKGEPHRLARDWIREAIILLEIKQACRLLTAYISSIYLSANYK